MTAIPKSAPASLLADEAKPIGLALLAKSERPTGDGAGRLPNGYLARIVEETGASRRELAYRAQFAERFPEESDLCNAVAQFRSWHAIVRDALPLKKQDEAEREPSPLVEGQFRVICAEVPS